ncbi:unnamed protein product [Periconia digitata]|uniref:Uncharacterized protein n=1 Tax=Periconia digitata TaxID=1303443 RepID=A0A9W4UTB5_9PLEO|nr:unnamed protein product [Periconia digitata]
MFGSRNNPPSEAHGEFETVPQQDLTKKSRRDAEESLYPLWQPIWLTKTAILLLVSLFVAIGVALIALWAAISRGDGIQLTVTSSHYAWTYGPTAILILIVGLWRQVDYYTMILQPWKNLQEGPGAASRSLLLDYVSPFWVNALSNAVRAQEAPVAIAIVATVILKLLVILSTGLLVRSETTFTQHDIPAKFSTKFDAKPWADAFDERLFSDSPESALITGMLNREINSTQIGNAYYAIKKNGADPPAGFLNNRAYQSFVFDGSSPPKGSNLTVMVDVFVPETRCEPADVTILDPDMKIPDRLNKRKLRPPPGADNPNPNLAFHIDVDSPNCHVKNFEVKRRDFWYPEIDMPLREPWPSHEITPWMVWQNCSQPSKKKSETDWKTYEASDGNYRWMLLLLDISYNMTLGPPKEIPGNDIVRNVTSWSGRVNKVSSAICDLKYTMSTAPLTVVLGDDGIPSQYFLGDHVRSENKHLHNLTDIMLNQAITSTFANSDFAFPINQTGAAGKFHMAGGLVRLFQLMETFAGATPVPFESLVDVRRMAAAAEDVFSGLSALYAALNMTVPNDASGMGFLTNTEQRLHINAVSLWLMFSCVAILTVLGATLAFVRPVHVVPHSPDTVEASAICLKSSSSDVSDILSGLGHANNEELAERLEKYKFQTSPGSCQLQATISSGDATPKTSKDRKRSSDTKRKPWIPFSIQYTTIVCTVTLVVAVIVALEVLQRLSDQRQGLLTIDDHLVRDYISWASTLVLFGVSTLFGSLDYTVSLFSPLISLRRSPTTARRTVQNNLVRRNAVEGLWVALRHRHFGAASSRLAVFCGAFLTIISSGLWTLDSDVTKESSVIVQRLDSWNPLWLNSQFGIDNYAAASLDLQLHKNMSGPEYTWGELAFPMFHIDKYSAASSSSPKSRNLTHVIDLPTLRANLVCVKIPNEAKHISYETTIYDHLVSVSVASLVPPQCPVKDVIVFRDALSYSQRVGEVPKPGFGGMLRDWPTVARNESLNCDQVECPPEPHGCPSLLLVFGTLQVQNNTSPKDITAFNCLQQLQEVQTRVEFKVVSIEDGRDRIEVIGTPQTDESSVRFLTNGTAGISAFPYHIENQISASLSRVGHPSGGFTVLDDQDRRWDPIIDNIVEAPNTSPEDFAGLENGDKLLDAVQHLYRQYMAHAIHFNMRRNMTELPDENTPLPFNATNVRSFNGTVRRSETTMKMDATSKLILQILLGVMLACGVVTLSLARVRGTLPHNPGTIAGTMSLVAGSRWVDEMDTIDAEVKKEQKFALRWWPDRTGSGNEDGSGDEGPNERDQLVTGSSGEEGLRGTKGRFGVDVVDE